MHFHNENQVCSFLSKIRIGPLYILHLHAMIAWQSHQVHAKIVYYNYKAQQQKRVVCVPPEEIKRTTGRELLTEVDRNPKIEAAYERWQFTALLCRVSKWEL